MHTRTMSRVGAVGLVCAFLLVGSAFSDSKARIVRLSYVSGDVQIDRAQGQGFERAVMNMPISEGMKVFTRTAGQAEVEFEDGSTVRLTTDTSVDFTELGLKDSGAKLTTLDILEGTAYFDIQKPQNNDEFFVHFPGQEILLASAVRFRAEIDRGEARLAVYKGEFEVGSGEHAVRVKKDETITLSFDDPARYVLANSIQPGPYDSWNNERQRFRSQYSSASANYNGPRYGYADLNYYGNSSYVPGYGYVWRPYGAGFNWDPFGNGSWAWGGGGYSWVSGYPWGWTPYHYGSWCFIPGFGWGWQAGNWNSWNNIPVIATGPTGWTPPHPPPAPPVTIVTGPGGDTHHHHTGGGHDGDPQGGGGKGRWWHREHGDVNTGTGVVTGGGTGSAIVGNGSAVTARSAAAAAADGTASNRVRDNQQVTGRSRWGQEPGRTGQEAGGRSRENRGQDSGSRGSGSRGPEVSHPAAQPRSAPEYSRPTVSAPMAAPQPSVNMGGGGSRVESGGGSVQRGSRPKGR